MVLFGHPKDPNYVNEIDANGEVNATLGHLVIATYYAKMRTISRLEILGVFPIEFRTKSSSQITSPILTLRDSKWSKHGTIEREESINGIDDDVSFSRIIFGRNRKITDFRNIILIIILFFIYTSNFGLDRILLLSKLGGLKPI